MAEEALTTSATTQADTASAGAAKAATGTAGGSEQNSAAEQPTAASIEKMIQSAVDRVRNQMGNENKKLRADLEAERKKNLSENEIKELERKQEREQFELERAEFKREKNKLFAVKALSEIGLNDGSADSLAIVDFVMADTEEAITERVKAFDSLVKNIVKKQVDGVFKANGRTPGVGSDTASNAGGENESYAVRSGKNAAAVNQKSRSILDSYGLGGK